jgi:hypothetical protein
MRRNDLVRNLEDIVGRDLLTVIESRNGWPALVQVSTNPDPTMVSLHAGPIGLSQRERDDVERRFQNPGSDRPIEVIAGTLPLLIGLWSDGASTILAGMDANSRIGRKTRFSLFMPLSALHAATVTGWHEQLNSVGEKIIAFRPDLLPVYVDLLRNEVDVPQKELQAVLLAAGTENSFESPEERGRRIASQLIRDQRFSRDVCASYQGYCAMCGLDYGLVVGAHIYPAAAPGSADKMWNGLALCQNHHAAFDSHRIFVNPNSLAISLHPELINGQRKNQACETFVNLTYKRLAEPLKPQQRPRAEMFTKRYEYFPAKYDWASRF